MDCPVCGEMCRLVIAGWDQFGTIRDWFCMGCCWAEGDEIEVKQDDESEEEDS